MTPSGLADVADYADGIGPYLGHVLDADGKATALVANAHAAGLAVHTWTLRKENAFLPPALRKGGDAAAPGDLAGLVRMVVAAGADGVFTDDPALVLSALGR